MVQTFITRATHALKLIPQPDAATCQAACVAMATKRADAVLQVRSELLKYGTAGDPYVMGKILKRECPGYKFESAASLMDMRSWLEAGEFLIIHTYLTRSGHVICVKGYELDAKRLSYRFLVNDPWSEFNAKAWAYNLGSTGYDGTYSSYLIYASAIVGMSSSHARQIYRRGELNSSAKNAWVHRIPA